METDGLHVVVDRITIRACTHQETPVRRQGLPGQVETLGGSRRATPFRLDRPALAARKVQHQVHLRAGNPPEEAVVGLSLHSAVTVQKNKDKGCSGPQFGEAPVRFPAWKLGQSEVDRRSFLHYVPTYRGHKQ